MFLGRSAAIKLVALCLLAAPGAALAQQAPANASTGRQMSYRSDRALRKVIIYGSLGAIVCALGSLRVRRGHDNVSDEQ